MPIIHIKVTEFQKKKNMTDNQVKIRSIEKREDGNSKDFKITPINILKAFK